jgi:DNA polymerase I-like protein with 3'-5' exonuclease and polymerase domains
MVGHHVCYPGDRKGLDYLSRFYLPYHRYWKDEGKFIDEKRDLETWFRYNCKDCCATLGVWRRISEQLDHFNLREQYNFQIKMWRHALRSMIRGVRIDQNSKTQMMLSAQMEILRIDEEMNAISDGILPSKGKTPWWRSATQTQNILYRVLRYPMQFQKKTKRPTSDDEALAKLREKDPLLEVILDRILGLRSLAVFANTFLNAGVSSDGRMRTTYDVTGTETFRLASRQDSFGGGMNLQNIPRARK